jgi:hypothetical protein
MASDNSISEVASKPNSFFRDSFAFAISDLVSLNVNRCEDGNYDANDFYRKLATYFKFHRKKMTELTGDETMDIKIELDFEKLQSLRIHNQTLLMHLIPKAEAKLRVRTVIRGINNLVRKFVKQVAKKYSSGSVREIEIYLTDLYNQLAKEETLVESWETEGSRTLLLTRLTNPDTPIEEIIKKFDELERLQVDSGGRNDAP